MTLILRFEAPVSLTLINGRKGLMIIAPSLPSPLIELLGSQGYAAKVERAAQGSWMVYFWRKEG